MSNVSSLLRSLVVYSICIPLAIVLGYLMANPLDLATFTILGALIFLLAVPLLLKFHHAWLIATWNTSIVLFFLPGRPQIWLAIAWLSLGVGVFQYILNKNLKFIPSAPIARPLLIFALIVIVTAIASGGIGLKAFGGTVYGGRRYFTILTAIIGFFALTVSRIPPSRAIFFVALFFLSMVTQVIGDLGQFVPPAFYFLFLIFPLGSLEGVVNDPGGPTSFMSRLGGLSAACTGICCFMLCRYGIQEIFTWRRLGRLIFFCGFVFISMFGGYRSVLMLFLLTFAIVFFMEGLLKSRMFPALILCTLLGTAVLIPFVQQLPLSVQRTLSFLPLPVSPIAKASAEDSTQWRLQIWKNLLPQVPEYLLVGKGYAINANEFEMVPYSRSSGADTAAVTAEMSGDYHNGPLSLIIPFGIFGTAAFLWFLIASLRALYQNYHHGDPNLRFINRYIFAYFLAKTIFFFTVFGSLYSDLAAFTGLMGLSLSINGGIAKPVLVPQSKMAYNRLKLYAGTRRPVAAQ